MFDSIWEDIKHQFRSGNMLTRIIILNVAIFVLVNLTRLIFTGLIEDATDPTAWDFSRDILPYIAFSSDWLTNLKRPWLFFTHMFLHEGFWHLLSNMLILYWFGRIVGDLLGDQRILPLYLLSGLAGAFLYLLVASVQTSWGMGGVAYGASAAVLGMVMAAAVTAPDYILHLILIGEVRLKYVALTLVFLGVVIGLAWNANAGGSIAHLGGAIMGYVFVSQLRRGRDLTAPITNFSDWLYDKNKPQKKSSARTRPIYQPSTIRKAKAKKRDQADSSTGLTHEEQLDVILAKIKKDGMDSLSAEEKAFLLNASKK